MTARKENRSEAEALGALSPELEAAHLRLSPIACALADAWCGMQAAGIRLGGLDARDCVSPNMLAALDLLEAATSGSALRKVRP